MERTFHRVATRLVTVIGLGFLVAAGAYIGAAPAAASSGIGVYVGYADSLRAQATNFPTPWAGSPQTTFQGCGSVTACVYDSGAVRIVNNSGSTVIVNNIAVHVDTCTFSFWAPATLAPGADLIVTQTAPGEAPGCTVGQMDTSDIGPGGSSYVGICTPNGILPTVDVTVNGTTTSYTDSGQVLNTGGFDAACRGDNESTQWTVIGHAPCRGSLLSLAPPTQTHGIGTSATVQATFTNSCGQPLSNVAVQFAVTAGPNAGQTGTGATNANGQATFTYGSVVTGTDFLTASVSNIAGSIPSNSVTVIWVIGTGGGAFVIGDLEAMSGAQAYWWGAQWWKADHLSSGLAPASFKGFENGNASPWCGQTWTTRPGNSSQPPKTVPPVMAVLVASHITKNGPIISGDIVKIVLVQTYPGYAANPGHIGTGKIIGTVCGQLAGQVAVDRSADELRQLDGVAREAVGARAVGRGGLGGALPGRVPVRRLPVHGVAPHDRRPHVIV